MLMPSLARAQGPLSGATISSEKPLFFCYEWTAENQLKRVTKDGAEVASFKYDPLGRRVEKIAGGITYSYLYDGMDILRETKSDGTTYTYVHGPGIDEPLARIDQAGTVNYYHADGLGSIVKMTDSAGSVIASRQYDAWGNLEVGADQPGYAFTGREWDPEIGPYYYRARYYDPKIGRFISEDPIGFGGGINLYSYVANTPSNSIDPFGLVDINLFHPTRDPAYRYAARYQSPTNVFTVAGHGNATTVLDQTTDPLWAFPASISVRALARQIRAHPNYRAGMTIRLMTCHAADGTYAQDLANELQANIEAVTGVITWYRSQPPQATYANPFTPVPPSTPTPSPSPSPTP